MTQFNGMGPTAPQGQNCRIEDFPWGACPAAFGKQMASTGSTWSTSASVPPLQVEPAG